MSLFGVTMLLLLICILFHKILVLSFKASYYERTIKNNKDLFTDWRYSCIKKVMDTKNIRDINRLDK